MDIDILMIDTGILTAKSKCLGNEETFGNHVGMSLISAYSVVFGKIYYF